MPKPLRLIGALLATTLVLAAPLHAHETRPGYLQIRETAPGHFSILWRTPVLGNLPLAVALRLPEGLTELRPAVVQALADSRVERRWVDAGSAGLAGRRIEFPGLQYTITDVLVRVEMLDGRTWSTIVRPMQPWVEVASTQSAWQVAGAYIVEGFRHIIFGIDHLLFVLGLMLIVKGRRNLVLTITAFTVAHSITLALATLGIASLPVPPLNAAIALSILFLGPEIVRSWRGEATFTLRYPWIVAFAFGLLHGFGFASGLSTAGMPRAAIPLALFSFNVGVEFGQLVFVFVALGLERAFRVLEIHWPRWVRFVPGYAVGSLGMFWFLQRATAMFVR